MSVFHIIDYCVSDSDKNNQANLYNTTIIIKIFNDARKLVYDVVGLAVFYVAQRFIGCNQLFVYNIIGYIFVVDFCNHICKNLSRNMKEKLKLRNEK